MRLTYVIKFVADMDAGVAFYRDVVGLPLRYATPFWSEFATGDTTLALHPASEDKPAGTVRIGLGSEDLTEFHAAMLAAGITFTQDPRTEHGQTMARFLDNEGQEVTVS